LHGTKWRNVAIEKEIILEKRVPSWVFGLSVILVALFGVLAIIILVTSLGRWKSFKIHSYWPAPLGSDGLYKPAHCGIDLRIRTVFRFLGECITVAILFAMPILFVGMNRNKDINKQFQVHNDKALVAEFFLFALKIIVFYIALQLTGYFDNSNEGFTRIVQGAPNNCQFNRRLTPQQKGILPTIQTSWTDDLIKFFKSIPSTVYGLATIPKRNCQQNKQVKTKQFLKVVAPRGA